MLLLKTIPGNTILSVLPTTLNKSPQGKPKGEMPLTISENQTKHRPKERKMDALKAIFTRRSIRKFTAQPVPESLIETVLRAAMSAPSAGNQQPWHFVVVDDRSMLDRIPTFCPYAAMCREASLGILVCGDTALERYQGFWVQDCSAATQNLLLAAHALGLGAVWTGVYPRDERVRGFRELLKLPDSVIPLSFVVIGYPAEHPRPADRFRRERIHRNRW